MKTYKNLKTNKSLLLISGFVMLFCVSAMADRLVWIGSTGSNNGKWSVASNWYDSTSSSVASAAPTSSDDVAIHDSTLLASGAKNPHLDANGSCNTITVYEKAAFFGASGYTFTITDSLGLSGNGTANGNFYVDGSTVTVGTTGSGDISGPGELHMLFGDGASIIAKGIVHVRGNFLPKTFERGGSGGVFSYVIMDGSGTKHMTGGYDFYFLEVDDNMIINTTGVEVDSNLTGTGTLIAGTNQDVFFLGDSMTITGFTPSTSTFHLWGGKQYISSYTFYNVDQYNSETDLTGNITISNEFDFNKGTGSGDNVVLGTHNLIISNGAALTFNGYLGNGQNQTGTGIPYVYGPQLGYVVTNGTGTLNITTGHAGTTFPIGASSSSFTPITLYPPASTSPRVDVRTFQGPTTQAGVAISTNAINNEWVINPESTKQNFNITTSWNSTASTDELTGFSETAAYLSYRHKDPTDGVTTAPWQWHPLGSTAGANTSDATSGHASDQDSIAAAATVSIGTDNAVAITYIATGSTTSLPVTLVSFGAQYQEGHVNLNWTTASEINNAFFDIERSTDAASWTNIGQVQGHGTSEVFNSYVSVDNLAGVIPSGTIYYRLKQVDFNGKFTYSSIRSVDLSNQGPSVAAYPNPTSNILNVNWTSASADNAVIRMVNMSGVNVYEQNISGKGAIQQKIDMSAMPSGVYYLQIISSNSSTVNMPVYKN